MKCDDYIVEYLKNNFSNDEILNVLNKNTLYFHFADKFTDKNNIKKRLSLNRLFNIFNMAVACNIFSDIEEMNIEYITFKGFVLSQLLYDRPFERAWGDIDFYVEPLYFENVYLYLLENGFELRYNNGTSNQHHVALKREKIKLELHRNIFHPMIGVNESFFKKNLQVCTINNYKIKTFNITASMLHLIYHLYMDTYLVHGSLYQILVNKTIPMAGRFLYRSYEIALFSEKYSNEIKWEEIENDLKCQKLRVIFKKMILDIIEIFPNTFSESFLQTVFQLDYVDDERDRLYKFLIDSEVEEKDKNLDHILSNYIKENWETRRENNIYKKVGENILLSKKASDETNRDLICIISTEKTTEGLKMVFKVSNDDFYISEIANYDTLTSDGVHLILCGDEEYSYNSIFFFPKEIDDTIRVVVCDVLNNRNIVFDNNLIRAEFFKTDEYYTITAVLSNEFIDNNHMASCFYMGLVISDCSSETQRRKDQLILSEEDSQWYNPIYFAKIDMK